MDQGGSDGSEGLDLRRPGQRRLALAAMVALALAPSAAGSALAGLPSPLPALAADDAYNATEDTVLTIAAPGLLENDNPEPLSCVVDNDLTGTAGTVETHPDGSFVFTPAENFNGATTFKYGLLINGTECTGLHDSQATVTISVAPVNDSPVAAADSFQALVDHTLHVNAPGVLSNDSDLDGDQLTATKVNNPAHGTVVLAGSGEFSYTPNGGYVGPDAFSYRAGDGSAFSPIRVVSLTVSAIPTPPPTATPAPTAPPTPAPTATPEVTAVPTVEVTPVTTPGVEVTPTPPVASAGTGPSPTPSAAPAADEEALPPLPVLIVILVFVVLLAFAASIYIPRWFGSQSGEPLDPE